MNIERIKAMKDVKVLEEMALAERLESVREVLVERDCNHSACIVDEAIALLQLRSQAKADGWVEWDRSMPLPDGLYQVITFDGSMDICPGERFYKDGVVKYVPHALPAPADERGEK